MGGWVVNTMGWLTHWVIRPICCLEITSCGIIWPGEAWKDSQLSVGYEGTAIMEEQDMTSIYCNMTSMLFLKNQAGNRW